MNKRYIDFVPQAGKKTTGGRLSASKKSVSKVVSNPVPKPAQKPVRTTAKTPAKVVARPALKTEQKVVKTSPKQRENLNNKFVRTTVEKRPLSRGESLRPTRATLARGAAAKTAKTAPRATKVASRTGIAAIKSEKVGAKAKVVAGKTGIKASSGASKVAATGLKKSTYEPPKNYFITQTKIEKRPLSKTVYAKRPAPVPEEKSSAPVTIISKPEKQNHAGAIVAVILTIILGAAAGTIAFLLLPK